MRSKSDRRRMGLPLGAALAASGLLTVGLLELVLAWSWSNAFGVCVGAAAVACALWQGTPLLVGTYRRDWAELLGREAPGSRLREKAAAFAPPLLGVACCLLLLVRLASPDPPAEWPTACPAWLPDGCTRVAEERGAVLLRPLRLHAPRRLVAAEALRWAAAHRGSLLGERREVGGAVLLHLRFVSRLWGFADDTWLLLGCLEGRTRVQAQSQLRLGRGDLGVNRARVADLWSALEALSDTGGACE